MSPEIDSFDKKKWLKKKMSAATPCWNVRSDGANGSFILQTKLDANGESAEYHIKDREYQIMQLICEGVIKNEDLAERMELKEGTIKNYLTEIFEIFDIDRGSRAKGLLFPLLVNTGILTFIPRIPEENWVGLRHENEPYDHASGI